jgi:preprotein translocase subunit SecA
MYTLLYGLTGTVGTSVEREEIKELYGVDTFDVPSHKPNRRKTLDALIVYEKEKYFEAIVQEVLTMQKSNRPTLILFETIDEFTLFAEHLAAKNLEYHLLNERQVEEEDHIIAWAGSMCSITIATNTAGRGTDISLHSCDQQGGLHVIFTFYPQNDRVEQQGVGRAGRQGQNGSARMILHITNSLLKQITEKILPNNIPGYTLQLEHLITLRQIITEQTSISRMKMARIEFIKHSYLQPFLEKMQKFSQELDPSFLSEIDQALQKAIPKTGDSISLSEKEELDLCTSFKTLSSTSPDSFTAFIQSAKSTLLTQIKQNWAELFYDRLDEVYDSVKTEEAFKKGIENLFTSSKQSWEQYLLNPKDSFTSFIQKITPLNLEMTVK